MKQEMSLWKLACAALAALSVACVAGCDGGGGVEARLAELKK